MFKGHGSVLFVDLTNELQFHCGTPPSPSFLHYSQSAKELAILSSQFCEYMRLVSLCVFKHERTVQITKLIYLEKSTK